METISNRKTSLSWILGIFKTIISESILLVLFLFPIRLKDGIHTISWMFLLVMLFSVFISLLLSKGNKHKVNLLYYSISIPLMIIGSILAGIPFWGLVIMIVFSQWRLYKLLPEDFDDEYYDNQNGLLLISIIVGILIYGIGKPLKLVEIDTILLLILLQFFISSYGTFMKNYFLSNFSKKSAFLSVALYTVIIPLIIGGIIVVISLGLREGLLVIVTALLKLIPLLGRVFPFLDKIIQVKNVEPTSQEEIINDNTENDQETSILEKQVSEGNNFYVIILIVFSVLAILAVIRFRRFKAPMTDDNDEVILTRQFAKKTEEDLSKLINIPSYSKATHQIRKYVSELEKIAVKKNIGRKGSESAREWLTRIEISCSNNWINLYEKVRYGMENVTITEAEQFINEYKIIKKQLKDRKPLHDLDEANS